MQVGKMLYTLGLDIGMSSVGAALLLPERQRILALHVRTFDKAETDKEGESLNKIRRDSRLQRRRIRRRAHRLLRLARLFKRVGLIETATSADFARQSLSAWELRAEGLDRLLAKTEWAAAIYHLLKHRGFQSNRKSEVKADEKAGLMLTGVNVNRALLQAHGYRSIGELVCKHENFRACKRNKAGNYSHTFARTDLVDELGALFRAQRDFGNPYASRDFESEVTALMLARKPALSGDNLLKMVGKCTFEKQENRAPKATYSAERFVWLGKLNNLKIVGNGTARPLSESERRLLIDLPFTQSKLTFKQARKVLNLAIFERFNLLSYRAGAKGKEKDPEEALLFEAKHFHRLRKAYETAYLHHEWRRDALDPRRLNALAYALTVFKDDRESREWLSAQGVEAAVIDAVLNESFEHFIHLSQAALDNILPFMEQGQRYDEAVLSAGYHHSRTATVERKTTLPPPDCNIIRNPVVYRALNQARKLVNAIIKQYGPPYAVHIEMARDLSKPHDERKKIEREQKAFQDEKANVKSDFESLFDFPPKALDLQKWRLFREQLDQCPYCQKPLHIGELFNDGYAQIDHALPFSRSFDDSMSNKVVVHGKCNQDKGNQTPYEFLRGEDDDLRWQNYVAWVNANKNFRQAKRNRLLRMHFKDDEAGEFRDRHLNDTRYICREFKSMLENRLQWHPDSDSGQCCVVLSGQLTALLRARWGLVKQRNQGDLHHALDAAVVAACDRRLIKRMSDHARRNELAMVRQNYHDPETGEIVDIAALRRIEAQFPMPWPHFRHELSARLSDDPAANLSRVDGYDVALPVSVQPVRVSRAPLRRGLGAAHQDTIRSLRGDAQSAVKTPLSALTLKDLPNIVGYGRDTALIEAIKERLTAFGGDGKKAFDGKQPPLRKPSKDPERAPIIRSVKLLTTQKSGLPVRGGIANNGAMLRIDVFEKQGKYYVVPLYVADTIKNELSNKAVVAGKIEDAWTVLDDSFCFLFSLHANDWVRVVLKDEIREGYFAGLDRSTAAISLWTHDRNRHIGKDGLIRSIGIKTALAVEKYHVDLLGNLYRVRREERVPLRSNSRKG